MFGEPDVHASREGGSSFPARREGDGGGDGWKRMVPKGWFMYPMFENREKYLMAIEFRGMG